MALVDPSIAMSFRAPEIKAPNMLAQYTQLAQLQGAQQQQQMGTIQMEEAQRRLERLRQDDAAVERIRQAAMQHGGPSDPIAIEDAMIGSGNPDYMKQGLAMRQHRQDKSEFQQLYGRMFPGMFPEAPAAAPTPEPSGAVVGGPIAPPPARVTPTPLGPPGGPAPVNAMAPAGTIEAMPINQLRATQIALGASSDPRAKTLSSVIEKEIARRDPTELYKQYLEAKSPAGGGFKGTFEEWKTLGTAKTTIHLPGQEFEGAYEKKGGAATFEKDEALVTSMENLGPNINKLDETLSILKTQDINTGLGAELFTVIDRAKALVNDAKAKKRVINTEFLDTLLGSEVFPQISALGIGARGLDTPAEREFLRKVITGSISLDKGTLIRMAELRRKNLLDTVDRFNTRVDKGELDRYFKTVGRDKFRVEMPKATTGSAPAGVPQNVWDVMTPGEKALWQK